MPLWSTCWHPKYLPKARESVQGYGDTDTYLEERVTLAIEVLVLSCHVGMGGQVGLCSSAIQFFVVWIAMQFLHACRLSLFLQFQAMGWTSHREVPASRAKGNTDMGPRGWQSKRVKPTSLAKLQHLRVPTRSKSQHAQGEQSPVRD